MDGRRFDEVTRLLGGGASRRSVVKGLFAAVGAVAVRQGVALAGDPCIANGNACDTGAQCCSGVCDGVCIASCGALGDACSVITGEVGQGCCGDLVCGDGGTCVEACLEVGATCTTGEECCNGYCSDNTNTCIDACISDEGEACSNNPEDEIICCNGFLCLSDNTCGPCISDSSECSAGSDCCSGYCSEFTGTCESCLTAGESCIQPTGLSVSCCEGYVCGEEGVCVVPCNDAGGGCGADENCCGELVCTEGICAVAESAGNATVTIHVATCPTGVGPNIFEECHDNVIAGIRFSVSDDSPGPDTLGAVLLTSGADGIAGPTDVGAPSNVIVAEDPASLGNYLTAYIYCAEQNSGTVLVDTDQPNGRADFAATDGDEIICDWYLITPAEPKPTTTATTDAVTTLPATGATGGDSGGANALLGAAGLGGTAALLAAQKLRKQAQTEPAGE